MPGRGIRKAVVVAAWAIGAAVLSRGQAARGQLPTTLENFFQHGTQPEIGGGTFTPTLTSQNCRLCHEVYNPPSQEYPIYSRWEGSLMANAARDPLFRAALVIANQDAAFAGDICLRCHTPGGWLEGRSTPTDGSALN